MTPSIVALDFDGVICDSATECLASAYWSRALALGMDFEPSLASIPTHWRRGFYDMRPFTRDGKDYLIILHLVEKGIEVENQATFDALSRSEIEAVCDIYKASNTRELEERFQEARRALRQRDEAAWMGMNPLYPGMAEALERCRERLDAIYLTTFKPSGAGSQILEYQGLHIPDGQIIGKDKVGEGQDKNRHMEWVHKAAGVPFEKIHFVDDQVFHLRAAKGLGVQGYFATWGYNTPQQAAEARGLGLTILSEKELPEWMVRVLGLASSF